MSVEVGTSINMQTMVQGRSYIHLWIVVEREMKLTLFLQ